MANPLLSDRDVAFLLDDVLDLAGVLARPAFADHDRGTCEAYLDGCRRLARGALWPSYRALDAAPPTLEAGRVRVHPLLRELWPRVRDLGAIAAARPAEVGGQQLPLLVATAAHLYLMAGGLSVYGVAGLTAGAGHLVEAFAPPALRDRWLPPLYAGRYTGTMALTEPGAGSSLADVRTTATPAGDHYLLRGAKIFISGGDHDLAEDIVHMVLARIDGAPAGIKGVSLFLVPQRRGPDGALVDNDVRVTGLIHKIGWRGLPSVALALGEAGDCHGWLVGPPHQGIACMFQMMNEARIMVGANGVATASVAYHEALAYARERPQGRRPGSRDPAQPQVSILAHADVRRMLLRQKAIVEGGLALILTCARLADEAAHAPADEAARAAALLDLLTPVAKTFPAERGFEACALAVQVHGGYGYSSEYVPEALLRDQKLNSIHEGTTGIQALDLLGRKVVAGGGAALRALLDELEGACRRAAEAGLDGAWVTGLRGASATIAALTGRLAARGQAGDAEGMLAHAADYLELVSIWVVAWQWLRMATAAAQGGGADADLRAGKLAAARYWFATELPRVAALAALCEGDDSYRAIPDAAF